jgi:hypothetical protein
MHQILNFGDTGILGARGAKDTMPIRCPLSGRQPPHLNDRNFSENRRPIRIHPLTNRQMFYIRSTCAATYPLPTIPHRTPELPSPVHSSKQRFRVAFVNFAMVSHS